MLSLSTKAKQRLDALPKEVTQAFHHDFVFLIYPDKIQHFPARDWSREQIINHLRTQMTGPLLFGQWQKNELVYSEQAAFFALLPL